MYNEINNYTVYNTSFNFPISKWISEITIDCTDWAVLYPMNDVAQWIACVWTWQVITAQFELYETDNLVLEDYLNWSNISFWSITIEEITADNTDLFSSEDKMQEFYIAQATFALIIILFIFINKFFKFKI